MCSGAGAIGCIFIHEDISEKNHGDPKFPMLQGWWGNSLKTKFMMNDEFDPIPGADVFKLSNPSPLLMACLMASLDVSKSVNRKLQTRQNTAYHYFNKQLFHIADFQSNFGRRFAAEAVFAHRLSRIFIEPLLSQVEPV